jgi:hypothetical protein
MHPGLEGSRFTVWLALSVVSRRLPETSHDNASPNSFGPLWFSFRIAANIDCDIARPFPGAACYPTLGRTSIFQAGRACSLTAVKSGSPPKVLCFGITNAPATRYPTQL